MSGLALWPSAGTHTRELFVRIACDADFSISASGAHQLRQKLTIKQALEVLEGEPKETP